MSQFSPQEVLTMMVDIALPRNSAGIENKAVVAQLAFRVTDSDKPEREAVAFASVLFHRPSNYTKVCWHITDSAQDLVLPAVWDVRSNHDSAWRGDGIGSVLSEICDKLKKQIAAENCEIEVCFLYDQAPKVKNLRSYRLNDQDSTFTVEYA